MTQILNLIAYIFYASFHYLWVNLLNMPTILNTLGNYIQRVFAPLAHQNIDSVVVSLALIIALTLVLYICYVTITTLPNEIVEDDYDENIIKTNYEALLNRLFIKKDKQSDKLEVYRNRTEYKKMQRNSKTFEFLYELKRPTIDTLGIIGQIIVILPAIIYIFFWNHDALFSNHTFGFTNIAWGFIFITLAISSRVPVTITNMTIKRNTRTLEKLKTEFYTKNETKDNKIYQIFGKHSPNSQEIIDEKYALMRQQYQKVVRLNNYVNRQLTKEKSYKNAQILTLGFLVMAFATFFII